MVNGPNSGLRGTQAASSRRPTSSFVDETHLRRIIDKIVGQVGRRIDESTPMVDARLPDGSRVNAVIHAARHRWPLPHHPEVLRPIRYQIDDLIRFGTLNAALGPLPAGLRGRQAQRHRLRRYRYR